MIPLLCALLSGGLFAAALPPYDWEWLAWFALAPLLVAAQGRRPLEAAGLGIIAGVTCGALHAGWNKDTTRLMWAYIPFLWLTMLFVATATMSAAARLRHAGMRWVLLVTCLGVSGEWLTTLLPIPIHLAVSQFRATTLIQIASVTGVWGVSFLLWLANAALADAILRRSVKTKPIAITLAAVAVTLVFGVWQLRSAKSGPSLRVAAIQDFSGGETGDLAPDPPANVENDRDKMTRKAAAQGAKLIVWSEECLGSGFNPDNSRDPTTALARETNAFLAIGYSDSHRPKAYNCAGLVSPEGKLLGAHHKVHLYLGESESVTVGGRSTSYASPLGRVGMEVCFDSCYTNITRQVAASGAQIIAMPNYDPPTPRGVLHDLHVAFLPFRAVENHVPFVRSDSNGRSQVVDAYGRLVGVSPLYSPDILVRDVALGDGRGTPFTRWGDWLAYLCLAGSTFFLGTMFRREKQTAPSE
ncbi:MAG: lnt [Capsulimonas sp.]|nr:lnt [Capsulimonas sp.]